jgi:HlyD family secretion protein
MGTLERDRLELIAESSEPIIRILVTEGQSVQAGDVLVVQDLGPMRARMSQAQARVKEAQFNLDALVSGPRQQEIFEARAELEAAESTLMMESREYERTQDLVKRKLQSESLLDQSKARRDGAQSGRKQAAARLRLLLEGTRIEALDQARAVVEQARAAVSELEVSAARYTVRAPVAGVIEALPYKTGERPPTHAAVAILLSGRTFARVYVPEPRRAQFVPGRKVLVTFDGSEAPQQGQVRFIATEAAFTPYYAFTQEDRSRLSYLSEIDLTPISPERLPVGIPVQVTLDH